MKTLLTVLILLKKYWPALTLYLIMMIINYKIIFVANILSNQSAEFFIFQGLLLRSDNNKLLWLRKVQSLFNFQIIWFITNYNIMLILVLDCKFSDNLKKERKNMNKIFERKLKVLDIFCLILILVFFFHFLIIMFL